MRAVVALVLLLSCFRSPVAASEVVIALAIADRDARLSATAEMARRVAMLLSKSGPEGGASSVRIEVYEDPCERSGSTALAKRIADNGAHVVVGHACPAGAAAAAPIYGLAGKSLVVAGALKGGGGVKDALFLPATDVTQGQYLGREMAAIAGQGARVAVVSDRTRWALGNIREAAAVLQAAGKAPVLAETFAGGDKDYAALSQRLVAAGVTHVVLAAFGSEAGLFVADLIRAQPRMVIVGTETLAGAEFVRAAGEAAGAVMIAVKPDAGVAKAESDVARQVIEGLASEGVAATRPMLAVGAAIEAVAAAAVKVEREGTAVTGEAIGRALRSGPPAATMLGPVTFDAKGQASVPQWRLHRWAGNRLVAARP